MTSDLSFPTQPHLSIALVTRPVHQSSALRAAGLARSRSAIRLVRNLLAESRPAVQFVFALRFVVASNLVFQPSIRSAVALGGWLCLSIAIYVFNGVTDVAADVLNRSGRPIAAGRLGAETALTSCAVLSVAGTAALARQGLVPALLAFLFLLVGWAYSAGPSWKEHPIGFGVVIGAGAAVTYGAGWATRGSLSTGQVMIGLIVAVWVGLCCACKDFSDIEGDAAAGRRTWPVLLGRRRARTLIGALAITASVVGVAMAVGFGTGLLTAILLLGGSIGVTLTLAGSARAGSRGQRRLSYRVFLATQYLANISIAI